jgi:hypothetical protein
MQTDGQTLKYIQTDGYTARCSHKPPFIFQNKESGLKCRYRDNQAPEDGRRANINTVVYIGHRPTSNKWMKSRIM